MNIRKESEISVEDIENLLQYDIDNLKIAFGRVEDCYAYGDFLMSAID